MNVCPAAYVVPAAGAVMVALMLAEPEAARRRQLEAIASRNFAARVEAAAPLTQGLGLQFHLAVIDLALEALYRAAEEDTATGGPDLQRGIFPVIALITATGYERVADDELATRTEALLERVSAQTGGGVTSITARTTASRANASRTTEGTDR